MIDIINLKINCNINLMISQKELFEYWENNYNFKDTCTKKEGKNIINLIKQIPKIYVNKILLIIKYYLESIDKIFLMASTVLEIYNYIKNDNVNSLHILYGLVRDFWNILKVNGHPSAAVCYHNTNFDLYDSETYYHKKMVNLEDNLEPYPTGKKLPYLFKLNEINFVIEENVLDV